MATSCMTMLHQGTEWSQGYERECAKEAWHVYLVILNISATEILNKLNPLPYNVIWESNVNEF